MNIGIDIRSLMCPIRTGVGEYTFELLNAIFELDSTNQYFLFYNSKKETPTLIPKWTRPNVHYVSSQYPNKIFNLTIKTLRKPRLDKLIIKHRDIKELDYFFSPNLNFTALSKKTKHILTIHDLSFELFPEFFTTKRRWWHHIINPKKQCQKADIILTPSVNTKRDLIKFYQIQSKKIQVIYPGLSSIFKTISEKEKQVMKAEVKKKYFLPENFILFLGTVEPRKNIIGLIEAYEKIFSSMSTPYSLIIAGGNGWKSKKIYDRA